MHLTKEEARQIYEEHSPNVYRVALFMTKSAANSEDIVQETFMIVFQKFDTYDAARPIKPWIYKIALNEVRKHLNKQRRQLFRKWPTEQTVVSAENDVLQEEGNHELWNEVSKLGMKYKEVIVLHFYLDFKLSEIAAMLGIPLGTCKSRLFYALRKLKVALPKNEGLQISLDKNGGRYI
ncbi:RNA polymerase sigma factor [Paenibacillus gorillae]|uniref:RNA polymerase sigma factor n=1 Tax=Paenibacillus gorillae TaxID=1243662 RepID=UPI0004B5BA11|nr:RNA polymerase sigma factor [Paenibacillus gorillae]